MSHGLTSLGIDHVVLERGQAAARWRSRWQSLQLLTPNWMNVLPGQPPSGAPDSFLTRDEVVAMLARYAADTPLMEDTRVERLSQFGGAYQVATSRGLFEAPAVVIATGQCDRANIPAIANKLPDNVLSLGANAYSTPKALPSGGVVVVGASASGLQLAEELQASGRQVTLCVGRHTRMPRRYRGHDIMHWLDGLGLLSQRWNSVPDIARARAQPSLQLVGRADNRDLDLRVLREMGVEITGRLLDVEAGRLRLATDLSLTTERAEQKLSKLLDRIDASAPSPSGARPAPLVIGSTRQALDLRAAKIGSVIWATGYRRNYDWLDLPLLSASGELMHEGGVTAAPGVYTMGLQFMRRRKSSFIGGVAEDTAEIAPLIQDYLNQPAAARAA